MTPLDWTILAAYALASIMAFVLMGVDKWRAHKGAYRISEATLLLWCICFGALGGWLGMQVFRHKIRKPKFSITVPVLMLAQVVLLVLYFRYWRKY